MALRDGRVKMAHIALLIIDEAHHVRQKEKSEVQSIIMRFFYHKSDEKPRILALTASPIEGAKLEPTIENAESELCLLESATDAIAWSAEVNLPSATGVQLPFDALPDDQAAQIELILQAASRARPTKPPGYGELTTVEATSQSCSKNGTTAYVA